MKAGSENSCCDTDKLYLNMGKHALSKISPDASQEGFVTETGDKL